MSVEGNLAQMELRREAYWLRYPNSSPIKLRWRANAVRHSLHVVPGENILETGLKPLLAGFDIQQVPISWMNRN